VNIIIKMVPVYSFIKVNSSSSSLSSVPSERSRLPMAPPSMGGDLHVGGTRGTVHTKFEARGGPMHPGVD